MEPLSIVGLFCEDIREEANEQFTLIGLIPDNIIANLMEKQGAEQEGGMVIKGRSLSQLCIYVRANFDPKDPLKEINLNLAFPDDVLLPVGGADSALLDGAKAKAAEKGNPLAGVAMRAVLSGFRPLKSGVIRLEATIDGQRRLLAALNVQVASAVTSSTEPQQPS